MKTILLMRHAKAELLGAGQRDFDRPLSERGIQDAARMGHALRSVKAIPDAIVASPARRARQTAEEVASALKHAEAIRWDKTLYAAPGDAWHAVLRKLDPGIDVALIVAHTPGVEEAAALLVGAPAGFLDVPTAGVVAIASSVPTWKDLKRGTGTLRWFLRPKLLEAMR